MAGRTRDGLLKTATNRQVWRSYTTFCWSVAIGFGVLIVGAASLVRWSPDPAALPEVETPVASIQLSPDRDGVCRQLLFHNTNGRFEDGGTGRCRGLIPDEMLVESTARRNEALARVFKTR